MSHSGYEIRFYCRVCDEVESIEVHAGHEVGDWLPNGWALECGKPVCANCKAPDTVEAPRPREAIGGDTGLRNGGRGT